MELRHLRYFVAVAERLHFSQAADSLGISPPTLTVQIKALEAMLQARLFNRTKRAVALTSAGEAFLIESRAILEQVDRAINVGRRAGRGEIGRVELGYVGSAAFSGLLQDQIRAYRAVWPDVMVSAKELPMEQLPMLLEEGRVDIAFVRMPMALASSLASHVLVRDRFCLALPAEHPLALAPAPVHSRALARESFVVPEQDLGLREVARRGKFNPHISAVPGSLLAVLTHVSLGSGLAVVPNVMQQVVGLPNIVFKEIAGAPIPSEVAAVFRRYERAPAVKHLIGQITRTMPVGAAQRAPALKK